MNQKQVKSVKLTIPSFSFGRNGEVDDFIEKYGKRYENLKINVLINGLNKYFRNQRKQYLLIYK